MNGFGIVRKVCLSSLKSFLLACSGTCNQSRIYGGAGHKTFGRAYFESVDFRESSRTPTIKVENLGEVFNGCFKRSGLIPTVRHRIFTVLKNVYRKIYPTNSLLINDGFGCPQPQQLLM